MSISGEIPIVVPWAEKWCIERAIRYRGRCGDTLDIKSERKERTFDYFSESAQISTLNSTFLVAGSINRASLFVLSHLAAQRIDFAMWMRVDGVYPGAEAAIEY